MKIGIGNWARPFASAWRVVVFTLVVCATGDAWARMTLLNYMNFDTVDGNAISLQNYGGTIVPVRVDGSTINKADSSKFGANAYKANDGVVGLQENTSGLVSVADGFTISFWFNPNGQSNWNSFFGFGLLNGDNYYFVKRGDNAFNVYKDTTSTNDSAVGDPVIGGVSYTGGAWNHVAIVCQPGGTSASLYVNGTAYTLSLGDISSTSLREVLLCCGRWHAGADSAFYRSKQTTLFDDFALFSGALTQGEVLVIAGGVAPISAIANSEFPAAVSLEEFGGFVTTEPQLAFKNATLSEITAATLKGRFSGASISAKGKAATFFNFYSPDSSTLTCEAQMDGDYDGNNEIFKSVFLTFTQSGDDVYVKANSVTKWMNKGSNELGTSLADQGTNGSLATSISASGYGIYNLNLPRTYESGATVVWNAGELLIPKFGSDGNKYVVTLPASGMSVDANGNLKVASSGATTGATIDLPDTHIASVLIKYSSLSAVDSSKVTLATAQATYNAGGSLVVVGPRTTANSALTMTGYWDTADENTYAFGTVPSLTVGSGYFMYSYHNDECGNGGTYAYAGTSPSTLSGGGNTGLRWTNNSYWIKKLSIGGPITTSSGVVAWPDVAIEKVALFIGSESLYKGSDIVGFSFVTTEATITAAGTYTLSGENPLFETVSADEAYVINVNESATLNIPSATTVNKITFNVTEGKTLTLTGGKLTAGAVVVTGGGNLVFDVSGYDCTALARNAVAGAPYRVWPGNFSSATGNMTIVTSSVEVPIGYSYRVIDTSKGPALEFTTTKQFGSLNINFYRSGYNNTKISDNASYSGLTHGAFPVVGTSWNDVVASNVSGGSVGKYVRQDGAVVNTGTATITIPSVGGWSTDVSGDQILAGYCDDGQQPEVTINNIPFAKYRVIVYAATDSKGIAFCPKIINGVSYSTAAAGSTATTTIPGGIGAWGNTDASRSTLAEGVNYLVSDVISDPSAVTIKNNKTIVNNRACITAVQIVEVGVDNTYDIDDAGTYDLATIFPSLSDGCAYEINVNESATLNVGAAATAGAVVFNVAAGKTLTISGSKITANSIYVNGEGKVACSAADTLSGTIKGDGRIVYTGTLPDNTLKTSFQSSNWTGTVEIKDYTQTTVIDSHRIIKLNDYGNVNSAVALNCVTSTMYAVSGTYPAVTLREIEIGEGGWSDTDNDYGASMLYTAKLTGHGPITVKTRGSGTVKFIGEHTFDGSVSFGSNTGKQVAFMRTSDDTIPAVTAGAIVVASGQEMSIASGKTWTATGGVDVRGSLTVNGTGSISGDASLSSSATLDISGFTGATPAISGALTLASGTTIKLPAGATLPYQIATSGDGGLIDNVTVQIGDGTPVTGTVALRNGAITTLASVDIDTDKTYTVSDVFGTPSASSSYKISVTADATLNINSAITVDIVKFNVAANKTLTLTGGAALTANQIYVNGEGKVACSAADTLSGTIKGDGRIVFERVLPALSLHTSFQDSANWSGTVEIKGYTQPTGTDVGIIVLNNYGNINSAVALNGVTSTMFANASKSSNKYPEVTLKEIEIGEDGWTDHANGPFSCDMSYTAKLTGHGPITVKTSGAGTIKFIGDHTFDGSVTMDANTEKQVAFMKNADDTLPSVTARSIAVASGASMIIASGKSWTAPGGVMIYGALKAEGSSPISHGVTLFETGTLDISGFTGEAPATPGAFTLNGGVIKLPADAELPYRIAASGDGAPSSCTIGDTTRLDLLLKDGALVTTRTATISTESAEITFGSIAWSGTGNDYTLTLQGGATYLTFDNTTVDYLKIIVQNNGALYIKGDMPANTTILGLTPLTIAASGYETFKAGYTRLFSQIGTTENGNGALNATGTISVSSSGDIPAGTYTLARWLTPQKLSTGYGAVGTINASTGSLSKELVYCVDRIVLRVWDADAQSAKGTIKIWPYGDSITEGFNMGGTKANYRVLLAQKLSLLGYNVEMVGTTDKIQTVNNDVNAFAPSIDPSGQNATGAWQWHSAKHGGTAGPTSAYERSNEMENVDTLCVQVGNPDAVLLLIGVNDLAASGQTAESTFGSWTNVINRLVANLPNSKIIASTHLYGNVANPTRAGQAPSITAFNNLVRPYMANMPAAWENHVIFLDLNELVGSYADKAADDGVIYNNPTGTADWLHPDWWGHDQMAEGWLSVITNEFTSTQTFPSATVPAAPAAGDLGAVAKSALADYRRGFSLCRRIDVASNLNTADPYAATGNGETEGIQKVGYFVEYVRADNHAHKWVWVDMDAFGSTIGDVGLPTAKHQQVVTRLHVKSNHNGIEDVAANDDTVTGFIEFSPYDYTGTVSGLTGAPTGNGSSYDWNDTLSDSGTMACMQVHRISPSTGRGGQVLFAYNNWRSSTTTAEFGIGNFSQHFHGSGTQTFDYTETKGLEKMNADAYSVKCIEIWTKAVYTAEMSGNSNFSALTFSPTLPGDISECDLVVNVSDDATLTFDSAKTVGSIKFNIAENKTLTLASTSNLTVGKVILSGPGKLQLSSSGTFGRMDVASSATLGFANGASLTVSGALSVASGATLTLEPAAISTASSTIISAASISGTVSVTLPSESGVDYSTIATETSYKIVRTPNVAFSYDGTIGATPTGWFTDVAEPFSSNLRVGPDSSKPIVYEVKDGEHPYNTAVSWTGKNITFALYADISQVSTDGKRILVGVGKSGNIDGEFLILYRENNKVKLAVWNVGKYNTTPSTYLVGTAASVDVPTTGYHLYTATFNCTTGDLTLYLDSTAGTSGSAGKAVSLPVGFQIGNLYYGVANGDWSKLSGEHGLNKGIGMAFAAIRGYDAVLAADNVEALAQQFPATSGSVDWHIDFTEENKRLKVCNEEFAGSSASRYLGITKGTLDLPAGCEVSVSHLRALNSSSADNSVSVNINGKMTITSTMDTITGAKDGYSRITNSPYLTYKGVLFGHWAGTGTYNIPTGGELYSPNAYVQVVRVAGNQTINVNGGKITAKALFAEKNNATINLSDGGEITVLEIPQYGEAIIRNFGRGTYRVTADATEAFAINFQGADEANATTLDPNGHTLTMNAAALTGTGYIKVASSVEEGEKGSVTFAGSDEGFTGTVVIDDAGKNLITFTDIAAYYGNIRYAVTGTSTLPSYLDGFTGTLTISGGTVDARAVDLSGATVILSDNTTVSATAGQEGYVTVASGTTLKLYVTEDAYRYDGNVFKGTMNGTLTYFHPDGGEGYEAVSAESGNLNGNNLLPYYQIWSASSGPSGTVNTAADWANGVPATERPAGSGKTGNAAFKVAAGTTTTVNVDGNMNFGEIQVYKTGSDDGETVVIFNQTDSYSLAANIFSIASGVKVQIAGNEPVKISNGIISGGVSLTVNSGATMVLDGVDCSTALSVSGTVTTKGATKLSNASNAFLGGSVLNVETGKATVTSSTGGSSGLGGTINIAAGATFENTQTDSLCYSNGAAVSVNVRGTLAMGATRWTIGGNNAITIYEGAAVTGSGQGANGSLDWFGASTLTISGDVTIAAPIKTRNTVTVVVDSGKTLTLAGGVVSGSGGTVNLSSGQIVMTTLPGGSVSIEDGAIFTLKDCAWTDSPGKFSGTGTLELLSSGVKCEHSVTSVTFAGKVKASNVGDVQNNFIQSSAAMFVTPPEFIMESANTHFGTGYYRNNADHPFEVKNLSGGGKFKSEWGGGNYSYVIKTKQTSDTTFTGTFSSNYNGGKRVMNLSVVGDSSNPEHSLTITKAQNTSASDTAELDSTLKVYDYGKVVFSSEGGWGIGSVIVGENGVLESKNASSVAATLTLQSGAKIAVPDTENVMLVSSLSTLSGVTYAVDLTAVPSARIDVPVLKVPTSAGIAGFDAGNVTVVPPGGSAFASDRWKAYTATEGDYTVLRVVVKPGTIFSVW